MARQRSPARELDRAGRGQRALGEQVDRLDRRPAGEARTLEEHLHHHRGRLVREVLEETGWNVREAAVRLDVARSYLYKLITLHGLTRPTE